MKILITGASSYVGASMYELLKDRHKVIGTYNSNKLFNELKQLDITKEKEVIELIRNEKPNIIIHVAANASGSSCEKDPVRAIAVNEDGTRYIVDAANKINSKVIFISSFAVANADSLYGRTKITSESIVKSTKAGYVILRPSLIIGYSPNTTNDRPFNRILNNIRNKTPAVYDNSWKFQPTWLSHLVEVTQIIIEKGIIDETIPVSVPELKTRYEIAKEILSEFKIKVTKDQKADKTPVFSEDLSSLNRLGLPQYNYDYMISKIIEEIKVHLNK